MECLSCGAVLSGVPESLDYPLCDLCFALEAKDQRRMRQDMPHLAAGSPQEAQRGSDDREPSHREGAIDSQTNASLSPDHLLAPRVRRDHQHGRPFPHRGTERRHQRRSKRWAPVAWFILLLSVALFTCGATLIGWSLMDDSDLFWDIGVPITLAGQAGFFIGLILQLDVLGSQTRRLNRQIADLQPLQSRNATPGGSTSRRHPAATHTVESNRTTESVTPALADLKSQLDGLHTQMFRSVGESME